MHELSVACDLVELAECAARDAHASRVEAVHLTLGVLSGVEPDALRMGFKVATAGTLLEGAQLTIGESPVVAWCSLCTCERTPDSIQWLVCPVCGVPLGALRSGREIELTSLQISVEETTSNDFAPSLPSRDSIARSHTGIQP